ncbi:MAG TPA: hypothetical protein DEB74_01355 [Lachnospiraceae bacterium]|nr:hypothetical protein [Lachnospiraceae bacterium]
MIRCKLKEYKRNRKELQLINEAIETLDARLEDLEVVAGKVTKSSKDFPYIEEHVTVKMAEPIEADRIKAKMREKQKRRAVLEAEIREVEDFIEGLPEGIEKQIFEFIYLEGFSQKETAEMLNYSKGRISQIISEIAKD